MRCTEEIWVGVVKMEANERLYHYYYYYYYAVDDAQYVNCIESIRNYKKGCMIMEAVLDV